MPSPQTILPWLLGGAIGAAGIFQGLHWKSGSASNDIAEVKAELLAATEELAILKRENEALRSLAQGGGDLSVPQELIDRVEKEMGLRYLSSPVFHRTSREELRDRIVASIESRLGPAGMDDRQLAYSLIGWLRRDDDHRSQWPMLLSAGDGGWFDEMTGEAWMLQRTDLKNVPDQATMMRLLVRVLLNQHFPASEVYQGDDAGRAREALHEGAAAGVESRFYAQKALTIGFLPMNENKTYELLLKTLPPFLQGLVNFRTINGKGLADLLSVEGVEKLHAVLKNPPQTSRGIFALGESRSEQGELDLPKVPEEIFLKETAGELGLRLWLEPLGDPDEATRLARDLTMDRYALFPDGESSAALVWEIEMSSGEAADRLEKAARKVVDVVFAETERQLGVARISPTRVRFLNTSERKTLVDLGGAPN